MYRGRTTAGQPTSNATINNTFTAPNTTLTRRKRGLEPDMTDAADTNSIGCDENQTNVAGKVMGIRDGPRRTILGDVSNGAAMGAANGNQSGPIDPDSPQCDAAGVSRNFRAKTIQATMATRAKALGAIGGTASNVPVGGGEPVPIKAPFAGGKRDGKDGKENTMPGGDSGDRHGDCPTGTPDWDDLDAEDNGDPLMVSEYVVDIVEYMRRIEQSVKPSATYMDSQKELNWPMRAILVDWLVEVQWKLKLLPETLFLTLNLIDRFLSKRAVSMVKLQLVGLTATMIAAKVEEVLSPSVANFIYLSDNSYDTAELLKAERYMLHVLNYELCYPSPLTFLRRCSKAEAYDVRTRTLGKYFMETALLDDSFVATAPSMLAAMSIFLARLMLSCGPWTPNLKHYSGYAEDQVKQAADRLVDFLKRPLLQRSIYKKYSSKKLMKASVFVDAWIRRTFPDCGAALAPPVSVE